MSGTAPGPSGGEPPRGWAAGPSPRTATLLLVLLSVPLLFAGLGSYSLVNGDEAIYRLISLRMLDTGDWFRLHDGVEPRVYDTFMNAPLHYWARALLHTVLGEGLAVSRLLSAVFGLATVLVTYRLALWLAPGVSSVASTLPTLNGRWAAFLAGLVQLTTYQFIWLHGARTGELETLVSFLVTASLLLFLRAVRSGGSFWLHHACLGALLMTKLPLPLLPAVAELCWFALIPSARPHLRRWLLQGLALLPLALAWHAAQALRLGDAFGQVLGTMAHEARSGSVGHELGRTSNWSYYARRLPFAVYPWGLLYPFAFVFALLSGRPGAPAASERTGSSSGAASGAELRLLALFVLVVGAFYLAVEKHAPWYPTPAYPALAVCVGLMLASLARVSRVPRALLVAAALCLGLLPWLDVALLSHLPFDRTAQQMGMRTRWLSPSGLAPGLAVALTSAAALALLGLIARRRGGSGVALALALPFVLVALVRCLAPLQHLGYQSALAQVRSRIDHRLAAGEPMRYPVALPPAQPWIVRATFIRDHRIVDRRNQSDVDPAAAYLIFAEPPPR